MATTDQEILDRVTTLISELTDIPKAELLPEKQLAADLEMDSLTTIELAVTIQDEFDIEVADDKLKELKTILDIVDLIDSSRLAAASGQPPPGTCPDPGQVPGHPRHRSAGGQLPARF